MLPTVSETQVQMNIYQKVFLWMIYSQQNQAGLTRYLRHWHSDSLHGTSTKAPECLSLILKQSFSTAVKGDTAGQLFQNSPQAWEKPAAPLMPSIQNQTAHLTGGLAVSGNHALTENLNSSALALVTTKPKIHLSQ